ncbi:retinol dehydrogenase 16-like [Mya arenaria]|nr:retinol dehydrogenase 16-like [Mya arenaria]
MFGYGAFQVTFAACLCLVPFLFLWPLLVALCVWLLWTIGWKYWEHTHLGECEGRGVFITGCDSGLGFAIAEHLDALGFTVFAGCYRPQDVGASTLQKECSSRLHEVPIDVRDKESVANAFAYVKDHLPKHGLWGVVNNAGVNLATSEVELTGVRMYNRAQDVNMYGPIRVVKAFLPLIRASAGRIINVTSVHGRMSIPRWSTYDVTKHGLETLSDSLRLEMAKFGVRVSIVEPGQYGFVTSIQNEEMTNLQLAQIDEMWKNASPEIRAAYPKEEEVKGNTPVMVHGWVANVNKCLPVARAVAHALRSEHPRARYLVGGYGTIVSFVDGFAVMSKVHNLLSTWFMDWWIARWTLNEK